MSERRNLRRILSSYNCDETFIGDEQVRERLNITNKCADGVGHITRCPYVIVEVTYQNLVESLQQIESTAEQMRERDCDIREGSLI